MNKNLIGALLVSMATAAFAADMPAASEPAKVDKKVEHMCQNNTCKGKADCKSYGNESCKGKNACKAMGYLDAKTKAECAKKGGKWNAKT